MVKSSAGRQPADRDCGGYRRYFQTRFPGLQERKMCPPVRRVCLSASACSLKSEPKKQSKSTTLLSASSSVRPFDGSAPCQCQSVSDAAQTDSRNRLPSVGLIGAKIPSSLDEENRRQPTVVPEVSRMQHSSEIKPSLDGIKNRFPSPGIRGHLH